MEIVRQMGHADWGMIRRTYARWIRCGAERQRKSLVMVGQKYCSTFKQACDQKVTKRCPNRPKSDQNMVTTTF
jgi:hypothetical protein